MKLPEYILTILNRLENYETYIVGGSVRDHLLKRPTNDYDITTSATTNQITQIFNDYPLVLNGIKHGTVRLIINHTSVEITTFRIDNNYHNHRQPTSVTFTTSLQEDLNRRDFTINALCYHPDKGIIDLTNGINDLHNKIIRCIGNPNKRFNEDALRILRALRFASKLDFHIDSTTSQAIHDNKQLLSYLSKERITSELKEILMINNKDILLNYIDIFEYLFNTNLDINIINQLTKSTDFITSISLIANTNIHILDTLVLSKQEKKLILNNIHYQSHKLNNKLAIKLLLKEHIDIKALSTFKSIINNHNHQLTMQLYKQILDNHEPFLIKHLAINGNDLLNLGITPTNINTILTTCLDKVMTSKINNTKEALLQEVKKLTN